MNALRLRNISSTKWKNRWRRRKRLISSILENEKWSIELWQGWLMKTWRILNCKKRNRSSPNKTWFCLCRRKEHWCRDRESWRSMRKRWSGDTIISRSKGLMIWRLWRIRQKQRERRYSSSWQEKRLKDEQRRSTWRIWGMSCKCRRQRRERERMRELRKRRKSDRGKSWWKRRSFRWDGERREKQRRSV
jgi:hypothetical protein